MTVVAALDDPLAAGAAGDDADMMAPDHDGADAGPTGTAPDRSPIPRKPEIAVAHAEVVTKPPAAPSARTATRVRDARTACEPRSAAMCVMAASPMARMHMMHAMHRMVLVGTRIGGRW